MQRAESVTVCGVCHHPREAHGEWRENGASPVPSTLFLRAHCGVKGCGCSGYVGLLWEKR